MKILSLPKLNLQSRATWQIFIASLTRSGSRGDLSVNFGCWLKATKRVKVSFSKCALWTSVGSRMQKTTLNSLPKLSCPRGVVRIQGRFIIDTLNKNFNGRKTRGWDWERLPFQTAKLFYFERPEKCCARGKSEEKNCQHIPTCVLINGFESVLKTFWKARNEPAQYTKHGEIALLPQERKN